jgi:branched-chain amino acid transport system substrate-binding protein
MMKNWLTKMILGLMLVPFLFTVSPAKTLKIGTLSPLTGPYAADGTDIKNGALTAISEFEQSGGMPGYEKIELFSQDTSCDPRQAVAAANKLINQEVIGVIGAYCSSSTIPASETLDEEGIIMITPASTNQMVTDRGLPYMFRMCGRDDDQSPVAAKFMNEYLKAKTVFILDDKTTYSQGLADGVKESCKKLGIEVLNHEHVNQGDKDFSAVLTLAKNSNADVFYSSLQGYSPTAMLITQARRLNFDATILTQEASFNPKLMDLAKSAADGVFITYAYVDESTNQYKAFEKRYSSKHGSFGVFAAYSYDATTALLKAIKAAGSTDPDKVKAQLMNMDFQGASKHVKFKTNGDSGSSFIAGKIINGKFENFWGPEKGLLQ